MTHQETAPLNVALRTGRYGTHCLMVGLAEAEAIASVTLRQHSLGCCVAQDPQRPQYDHFSSNPLDI